MINREDMLELTRRMTVSRTHFVRLAGAYLDEEGFLDGNFNTNFMKLKDCDKQRPLNLAKEVLLSETNRELTEHPAADPKPGSIWQLLYALRDCELKNDALLMSLYDLIGTGYPSSVPYAVYVCYGAYDIPAMAGDKYRLDESREVYRYLLTAIGPIDGDYNPLQAECGFLYPAFKNRSTDFSRINVYGKSAEKKHALCTLLNL